MTGDIGDLMLLSRALRSSIVVVIAAGSAASCVPPGTCPPDLPLSSDGYCRPPDAGDAARGEDGGRPEDAGGDGGTNTPDGCTPETFFPDADGDGRGEIGGVIRITCPMPTGYARSSDDCDDTDGTTYPGASEVCDGADNDCNGFVDEGLAVVGPPVTVAPSSISPHIVGTNEGFGVLSLVSLGGQAAWWTISSDGSASVPIASLGSDSMQLLSDYDLAFDGARVIVAGRIGSSFAVFGIDPASAVRVLSAVALPRDALTIASAVRIARVTTDSVVIYGEVVSGMQPQIRRWLVSTSGSVPIVADQDDVVTDLGSGHAWAVTAAGPPTSPGELLVYRATNDDLILREVGPSGTGASHRIVRTAAAAPATGEIAVALPDSQAAPSLTNPLTVVYAGVPGQPLAALQITDVTAPTGTTSVMLPGSFGSGQPTGSIIIRGRHIWITPPAGVERSRLLYVTADEYLTATDTSRVLRVWELRSGAPPQATPVPFAEDGPRDSGNELTVGAVSDSSRIAHAASDSSLVTRQLGCR